MKLGRTLIISAAFVGLLVNNVYGATKPAKKFQNSTKTLKVKVAKNVNYAQIVNYIDNESYSLANNEIYNALKINPNDINARSLQIISMIKNNQLDVAQAGLEKYLPLNKNNAFLHYAKGLLDIKRQSGSDMDYRDNSEYLIKDAMIEFNTAIRLNPKFYQAYNALGVVYLNLGDLSKASQNFAKAISINPKYSTAVDNMGSVYYLQKDYDMAQSTVSKALALNPSNSTAYFHMAQIYDKKSLYSKALDSLEHSLRINSENSVAYNLQGEILKKQGNEAAAIECFKKSIAIRPENTKPYLNLAKIYERRFDNYHAIENLKSALAVNPSLSEAKLAIGNLSLLNKNTEQAIRYYSSLVGVEGYNADALKGLSNSYFALAKDIASNNLTISKKELESAYENIEKALVANPNDLELYLAKLKLAKLTNRPKETQESLDKIIAAPARGLNDVLAKGDAYFAMNKYQKARETFEKSVVYARSLDDYLFVSEILTYDKFYPSAKAILRKALSIDSSNEEALHNLNYIMTMEKQSELLYNDAKFFKKQDRNKVFAREYAIKALDFNPTNKKAAILSAKLCEKQKHYDKAVAAYRVVAGLEDNQKKVKRLNKKIEKLEKKIAGNTNRYMKKENKKYRHDESY